MLDTDTPVADALEAMTATSLDYSGLPDRELMLARLAALVAVDAQPAMAANVTLADVQGLLVAVAPVVGTARVLSASVNIAKGIGYAVALVEGELEAEANTSDA